MSDPKRLQLRHGNIVRVWGHTNEPYELALITEHNGSCLMVVEDREEMISIADAILAAVKAKDDADRAALAAAAQVAERSTAA